MATAVRTIPATLNKFNSKPVSAIQKRRVAGYARVSTDFAEQATSYEAQMEYYKAYIQSKPDWIFVDMYSDEGISATTTKHRDGFKRMIDDAMNGKIDLIITKSVSRFARNTVDSLSNVRMLKEKGVEVYFEKENIWTLDAKGELLITIMSSLAQEESRSISENTTWGARKRFADGKASVAYTHFLGYDKDFKINEKEAEVVRYIYKRFISGISCYAIGNELESKGILSPYGLPKWWTSTIISILKNEKYKGDALLQKSYSVDFLQKVRKANNGEVPQYYVENHHEAIISPETFELAQLELKRRSRKKRYCVKTVFTGKILCGICGNEYGSRVHHSNDECRREVFTCGKPWVRGVHKCPTKNLTVKMAKQLFTDALNKLVDVKKEVIDNLRLLLKETFDTTKLKEEHEKLESELNALAFKYNTLMNENARHFIPDQQKFISNQENLAEQYNSKQARYLELEKQIADKEERGLVLKNFIKELSGAEPGIEFREDLWCALLDHIVVLDRIKAKVIFKDGTEELLDIPKDRKSRVKSE